MTNVEEEILPTVMTSFLLRGPCTVLPVYGKLDHNTYNNALVT